MPHFRSGRDPLRYRAPVPLSVLRYAASQRLASNAGPEVIPAALANRPVSLTPASQLCRSTVRLPKAHSCIGSAISPDGGEEAVRCNASGSYCALITLQYSLSRGVLANSKLLALLMQMAGADLPHY